MGSTNHGTQSMTFHYFQDAKQSEFAEKDIDIRPCGIYSGGHLTRVSNTEITLSLLVAEIGDGSAQISVRTALDATLKAATLDSGSISSATPYIVLRWAYVATANNYVEVHAIASVAAAQANDIIVGKCVFSGATLTGFDYTDRTLLNVQNVFLRVEATEDTEMYVWVRGGRVHNSTQCNTVPEQKVGPFAVPGAPNSRIDLVYIDDDGDPQILQGVAAPSPSAPSYGGRLVVAQVRVVNGDSDIPSSRISDVRSFIAPTLAAITELFSSNGYVVLSNGLVIQWGTKNIPANITENITLPMAYPTAHLWCLAHPRLNIHTGTNSNLSTGANPLSLSQIQVRNGSGAGAIDMQWISIGY